MKPNKKTLAKWYQMTDENEHFEVRKAIAKYFNFPNFIRAFDELIEARDKPNGYGTYCLSAECLLTDLMFQSIEEQHGKDVSLAVNGCL